MPGAIPRAAGRAFFLVLAAPRTGHRLLTGLMRARRTMMRAPRRGHVPVSPRTMPAVSTTQMDFFLQACGADESLQMSLECQGTAEVERLIVDTPFLVIGRDPGCDLVLDHPDVGDR